LDKPHCVIVRFWRKTDSSSGKRRGRRTRSSCWTGKGHEEEVKGIVTPTGGEKESDAAAQNFPQGEDTRRRASKGKKGKRCASVRKKRETTSCTAEPLWGREERPRRGGRSSGGGRKTGVGRPDIYVGQKRKKAPYFPDRRGKKKEKKGRAIRGGATSPGKNHSIFSEKKTEEKGGPFPHQGKKTSRGPFGQTRSPKRNPAWEKKKTARPRGAISRNSEKVTDPPADQGEQEGKRTHAVPGRVRSTWAKKRDPRSAGGKKK